MTMKRDTTKQTPRRKLTLEKQTLRDLVPRKNHTEAVRAGLNRDDNGSGKPNCI